MVRRLPAGPAICWLQGNACFLNGFKGFRGSHYRIQRPPRAAPGRYVQKTKEFPTFSKRPAVRVSATKGRFHLLVTECFSTAQAHWYGSIFQGHDKAG